MISTKKYKLILIIQFILIVGVLGGGGYLVYQNINDKDNKEEIKEEEVVVPDIKEVDTELVDIDINENIVYEGYDVTIRIPKVTDERGTDINNKIKEDLKEYYENKDTSIEYNYYTNNDIVSIVIRTENKDKEENYYTYNFNTNDYTLLDNHKLLELKDIKEDSFHGLLVNIYEAYLKDHLEEGKTSIDVTSNDYKKTTDKDNCIIDLPMYFDHDNHLNVVVNEYKDDVIVKQIYNLNAKKVVER
jgi:hypothetical protein